MQNGLHSTDESLANTEDSTIEGSRERESILMWLNRWLSCEPRDLHSRRHYKVHQPWLAFVPSLLFIASMLTMASLFIAVIR